TGMAVEQRQLAEKGAGFEAGQNDLLALGRQYDVDDTFFDDVEVFGQITVIEYLFPRFEQLPHSVLAQRFELSRRQVCEQRHIFDLINCIHSLSPGKPFASIRTPPGLAAGIRWRRIPMTGCRPNVVTPEPLR